MGNLRSTFGLSLATLFSRILGLIRDQLFAAVLGGGMLMSAWSMILLAPNFLRRIFGEGAMASAFVPIITHTMKQDGPESARKKFSTILFWLTLLLTVITIVFSAGAWIAEPFFETRRYKLILLCIPVIMPHCILICLTGVLSSYLNTLKIFFRPAMAALIPNFLLIAATLWVVPHYLDDDVILLKILSVAVVISGLLECAVMFALLRTQNMLPHFNLKTILNFEAVRELWRKFTPGLIGAIAFQVGALTDSLLAISLHDYARSGIYFSDRLVYLPVGLFAVAFGTVSLTTLSRYAAEGKIKTMLIESFASMRQLMFLTVPTAAVMILFSRELLSLFFGYRAFDERALNETWNAMVWLAFGIPAFSLIKLTVNTFYCRKSMRIPAIISICCIILNIGLSALLMFPMKQGGITLATSVCSFLNNIILFIILKRQLGRMPMKQFLIYLARLTLISAFAAVAAKYLFVEMAQIPALLVLPKKILPLLISGMVFMIFFFVPAFLWKVCTVKQLSGVLHRKKS